MALGTVNVRGADAVATNFVEGSTEWETYASPALSGAPAGPVFLHKVVVFVPTATAATVYVWLMDYHPSFGGTSLSNPVCVLACPPGFTTTLDFGMGKLFQYGLLAWLATDEPTDPDAVRTPIGNNKARISLDYRAK